MFSFARSSGGGSTPSILLSRREPLKNAVLTSKLWMTQRRAAQYCRRRARDSFCSVGESLGMSVRSGSMYPRITSLAFALRLFPSFAASIGSRSFQVSTHLHFKIFSSGILCRRIFRTVSVASHWSISLFFAAWNSASWLGERSLSFTSALCLLAAEAASNGKASGSFPMVSKSPAVKKISHSRAWSSWTWRTSWKGSVVFPPFIMIVKTVMPVQGSWVVQWSSSLFEHQLSVLDQIPPCAWFPVVHLVSITFRMSTGQSAQLLGSKSVQRGRLWIRRSLSPWHIQTSSTTKSSSLGTGTSWGAAGMGSSPRSSEVLSLIGVVGVYPLLAWDAGGIFGSESGCSILSPSEDIVGGSGGNATVGALSDSSVSGKFVGPACWVRSSYWKTPLPWSLSGKSIREVANCSMLCWASCKDKLRMCSGATLYTRLEKDIQTTWSDSWMMTLAGPCHWPRYSPFPGRQNMTKDPPICRPRWGLCLRRNALRSFSLLSACAKALRAHSRYSRCFLKASPSGVSDS